MAKSTIQIESMHTVVPMKVTDTRPTHRVLVTDHLGSGIFRRCLHIVLYYRKVTREDSGWFMAGWIRESLGTSLVEQPMLSGRLRLVENGDGEMELVPNDSGVRLIEARISITLAEFLDLKGREDAEAEVVFWKDIDEQNPQFSPLFYVQVTNFQCGGYSIGISCSLLLADPLFMTSFLKKWAKLQSKLLLETDMKTPMFYLPNLKQNGCSPKLISSNTTKNRGQTMFFKINSENEDSKDEMRHKPTLICIEKAGEKLGIQMVSKFSLFVKDFKGDVKVEVLSKEGLGRSSPLSSRIGLTSASNWDDFGINEVAFHEGNKPVCVSHWIGLSSDDQGLVMVVPSRFEGSSGMNIVVTIPNEKEII